MPAHPTITDIRSWHGLVNKLALLMAIAPVIEPFRELLKKPLSKKVCWDEQLQWKFDQAKSKFASWPRMAWSVMTNVGQRQPSQTGAWRVLYWIRHYATVFFLCVSRHALLL